MKSSCLLFNLHSKNKTKSDILFINYIKKILSILIIHNFSLKNPKDFTSKSIPISLIFELKSQNFHEKKNQYKFGEIL
jgi:hypothetical protein